MADPTPTTLERLFQFLPNLEEVEELRLSIVGASVLDPGTEWDSSRAFATIDKRVVSAERIEQVVSDAEEALHQHVARLFSGCGRSCTRCSRGRNPKQPRT